MSIIRSDIRVYGSANMQETDSGSQGGAIDTAVQVVFDDISSDDNIQVVSSAAGDTTQTVTVTGRNAGGSIISEVKTLTGTTPVAMTTNTTWDRILKAVKSATTTGDVAVERATAELDSTLAADGTLETSTEAAYVTLPAGASAVDDYYNGMVIRFDGGTAVGQIRRIVDYDGTSKKAYVNYDWGTEPDSGDTFIISEGVVFEKSPTECITVRRPFYNASANAAGGASKDYYEKLFVKNLNSTNALLSASITESADPSTYVTFALEDAVDDTGTSTNRLTAPTGSEIGPTGFDSNDKALTDELDSSDTDLAAGEAIGVWLKLTLAAGTAASNTTYTIGVEGSTT